MIHVRRILAAVLFVIAAHPPASVCGAENWQTALAKIPVRTNSFVAHLTPPVALVFNTFKPSPELRGIVLMPGAADGLYFFNWGRLFLPENPTLLDVIAAITNRVNLRATYTPPLLLLHGTNDLTTDPLRFADGAANTILKVKFPGKTQYLDRSYDRMLPEIEKQIGLNIFPIRTDTKSWHYYRVAFTGYDLSGPELLRAMCYTMKTVATVEKDRVIFSDRPASP